MLIIWTKEHWLQREFLEPRKAAGIKCRLSVCVLWIQPATQILFNCINLATTGFREPVVGQLNSSIHWRKCNSSLLNLDTALLICVHEQAVCDNQKSKQWWHCLQMLHYSQGRVCESHWQWGGCSSRPTMLSCHPRWGHPRWGHQRSISQSWGRITEPPPLNSPMSYTSNTDRTSGKESHGVTNADLLIRLGSWGESLLARQRWFAFRARGLVLKLTLLRKSPSSLTM